jgi:hypothetical protein
LEEYKALYDEKALSEEAMGALTDAQLAEFGVDKADDREKLLAMSKFNAPEKIHLKQLEDAIDNAVYVEDKWPLILDTTGDAMRFLRYQRGCTLSVMNRDEMSKESLRMHMIACLKMGSLMTICFEEASTQEIRDFFEDTWFPADIMKKSAVYTEEFWGPCLRKDQGDAPPEQFIPRDEFKMVFVVASANAPPITAAQCHIIQLGQPDSGGGGGGGGGAGGDAVAAAFGIKETIRNSADLVEDAFEGDLDAVKGYIDKGFYIDSVDARKHSGLSEASVQGHDELVEWFLAQGSDPNLCNDEGRSSLYRAAYNGHGSTVELLLKSGADPRLKTKEAEGPYDVAKDDETRSMIEKFPEAETERLIAKREAYLKQKLEERITTQAERELYQRSQIKEELIKLTVEGSCEALKDRMMEIANHAEKHDERPQGTAEVRGAAVGAAVGAAGHSGC